MAAERPALRAIEQGLDELRMALERELFAAMDADAGRIRSYVEAARSLEVAWPELDRLTTALPLRSAHQQVVACAERWLTTAPIATGS
ncbi:MAG TPA: hypothetical protein VF384_04655 [Planctomycetota bacterium]